MTLNDKYPFTDEDHAIINSYKAVVDGVSALIGEHCEIVLHSLEDIEHSAICIANGHNTNRQVGFANYRSCLTFATKYTKRKCFKALFYTSKR